MRFRQKLLTLIVPIILLSGFSSCDKNSIEPDDAYILIYNGKVADVDGVMKIAEISAENGFAVAYISNLRKLPALLASARAFVIGGTDDDTDDLLDDLYEVQDELKTYIEKGGNYLGICGGAYVASKGSQWDDGYETGMGLVDIDCFAYDVDFIDPQIITINWFGSPRTIYYQYGPAFAQSKIPEDSKIFAVYNNLNQDVAIFETTVGQGTVILCGPHPEADATWLLDDPEPVNAHNWKETKDMLQYILMQLVSE